MSETPTLLMISGTYLPGTANGGPVRSVANMVAWLGDDFHFSILTTDRDRGDTQAYAAITAGAWHIVGKARVYYLSPHQLTVHSLAKLIRQNAPDILFIDSILGNLSIKTLIARRLGLLSAIPTVITPRGHLSPGALNIKPRKKRFFLRAGKLIGIFKGLHWLVSSNDEWADVQREFGTQPVTVIPNLSDAALLENPIHPIEKETGCARFVFLSRITPKKNLLYLLHQLHALHGMVSLDIYGHIEDQAYWSQCQLLIQQLPAHIQVNYQGSVPFDRVLDILSRYHLFILPTHSENFGHVIIEALASGCPVLISDQTPWHSVAEKQAGWVIALDHPAQFQETMQAVINMDQAAFTTLAHCARAFAIEALQTETQVTSLKQFLLAVAQSK